ncbi:sulfotransferase [Methylotuvimicrobium sp. KM2]|uniref:sulfotransferase n=1 Tax=Methylotuvimicrobium sp. KM2 TaxID=3133976 RepID=UPI0031011001
MSEKREQNFRRNGALEALLSQINTDLQPSEYRLVSQYQEKAMQRPLILVMGPLRSGTTLFMQWLANTGISSYPTNLLSRFYQAPIIGAKIQLLLTDPRFNFRDELEEFTKLSEYKSENGKTQGVLAPNEFWYFWRRFLSDPSRDVWTNEELRQSLDVTAMKAELNGIMDVFQKPFAAKGMLFNYNIPFLDSIFEKVLFVQIKRDPIANVASVLEARKRQLGSEAAWYSFKIPEYKQLKYLDPITQASGQVHYINKAVDKGADSVDESRKIIVQYEAFCADPEYYYNQLIQKLGILGTAYPGTKEFTLSRTDIKNARKIEKALQRYL